MRRKRLLMTKKKMTTWSIKLPTGKK